MILPSHPIPTSGVCGDYVFGEGVSGGGKDKKDGSGRPPTPIIGTLEDSTPRQLSKSRTFNVLSGITASFSRSTLAPSRRTTASSNGSSASLAQVATADTSLSKAPPISSRLPVSKSGRLSLGSHKSDLHLTQNPCCIYTEQPSAYWAGRFNSLHDKFLAECLTPNNLHSILEAQAERAKDRNQQLQPHLVRETQYTRFNTRLPPSATSAAILQQTGGGGGPGSDTGGMHAADAELLLDEDERSKRVFVHLETFCATDEARRSLFAFQQDYARKMRRPKLLPRGGTMGDRNWGSYMSRMGVKRIGKRASMY